MRTALRSNLRTGYSAAAPSEMALLVSTRRGWLGELPPLVYCHGSGDTSQTAYSPYKAGQWQMLRALASRYMVIAADLGGQVWGNDTHIARVGEAVDHVRTITGDEPVTLVAGSMGNLGALNWVKRNPTQVRAFVGLIPALDLAQLLPFAPAEINAAYGGAYNDATDGPTHSPVQYADQIPDDVPISLFTSSNDPICFPSTADAFVAARPATERVNLGALGHTEAAIQAAVSPVVQFLGRVIS